MRRFCLLVGFAVTASCTLDFDRFESAASSTVVASNASTGGAGTVASAGGAAPASSGGGVVACNDQYGDAPGYMACNESATECEFNASVQSQSCLELCAARGGECLFVYNDDAQDPCAHGQSLSCSTDGFASVVCICSRGCGTGGPCSSAETCMSGACQ